MHRACTERARSVHGEYTEHAFCKERAWSVDGAYTKHASRGPTADDGIGMRYNPDGVEGVVGVGVLSTFYLLVNFMMKVETYDVIQFFF